MILVVDDEPAVRGLAQAILRRAGYCVLLACDGASALDLLRVHHGGIRAVVLDLTVPDMPAETLVGVVADTDERARILLSSGQAPPPRLAAWPFLAKPYTAGDLLRAVEGLL